MKLLDFKLTFLLKLILNILKITFPVLLQNKKNMPSFIILIGLLSN